MIKQLQPLRLTRFLRVGLLSILIGAPLGLSGCRLHSVVEEPIPPVTLPETWSSAGGEETYTARWWETFNDADLTRMVESALGSNMDIHAAWARLDRAEAYARQAGAGYWPQLEVSGVASKSKNLIFTDVGDLKSESNRFSLSAVAGYEIDLWGKIGSMQDSATLEFQATAEDIRTISTTVAASTALAWTTLAEKTAQRKLLDRQLEVGQTYLDLVELRYGQGIAGSLDVYQQRNQVAAIRSQLPSVDAQIAVTRNQLAVLTARSDPWDEIASDGNLPTPPPLPALGIPSSLIAQRPDVKAMQLRVTASDHRIGAAVADRFPSIRLTADIGYLSKTVADLFQNWIYSLAAAIAGPVIDGGRRSAEVSAAEATQRELLAGYGKTVLGALAEVENALAGETGARLSVEALEAQEKLAEKTLAEARDLYLNGLSDYLPVLTALQLQQNLERQIIGAQALWSSQRIQLHRALGGAWMVLPARPSPLSLTGSTTLETESKE